MNKIGILVIALLTAATAHAADKRYPVARVQKVEITTPSAHSAWENKDFLDCNDVVLTEKDVLFALRHMRRVSEKSFFSEETARTGCEGEARVVFANGKIILIGVEPTGRISTLDVDAQSKPVGRRPNSFYECEPCAARMDMILQGARNRADERRLKRLEAEGKIPPGEAEVRLKRSRE